MRTEVPRHWRLEKIRYRLGIPQRPKLPEPSDQDRLVWLASPQEQHGVVFSASSVPQDVNLEH